MPALCPGLNDSTVDAAAAVLLTSPDAPSDGLDSFYALEFFVSHYDREPAGTHPKVCTDVYLKALARMRLRADTTVTSTAVTRMRAVDARIVASTLALVLLF